MDPKLPSAPLQNWTYSSGIPIRQDPGGFVFAIEWQIPYRKVGLELDRHELLWEVRGTNVAVW
jgi:hypothetical protein